MVFVNNGEFSDILINNTFSFKSKNIRSFQAHEAQLQHDRTSTKYHYTSAPALYAILNTSKEFGIVRFTDARYMNDRSEHMYFIKRLLEFMETHRVNYQFCQEVINKLLLNNHVAEDYISLRVSEIEETESGFFSYKKDRHFLFCLCKEDDSLHMWNYYVHNGKYQGYNIGIKIYDFLKYFDKESGDKNDPIRFYCGDVLYKKSTQEEEIKLLCDSIEELGLRTKETHFSTQLGMLYLWSYIQCYGLFFKDEKFSDEKEYRIVLQFEEAITGSNISTYFKTNNDTIKYEFFERNGIIVPCLKVPLIKKSVKQITLSPMLENHIANASIKEFLEANEYSNVVVKQSSVPIRY